VSDTPQGPGWWQASDGKWYPPEATPGSGGAGGGVGGISNSGPLAEWGPRAVGLLIDYAAVFAILLLGWIVTLVVSQISSVLGFLLLLVVWLVSAVAGLYLGYLVGEKGRSPGMAIMGLRCVNEENGQTIGGGQGVVRSLAHIVDSLICYVGWFFPLWDPKKQTIADKLIKTIVVADQPKEQFSIDLFKP
jgi:uncharacterized RDD family membrane protein YckC